MHRSAHDQKLAPQCFAAHLNLHACKICSHDAFGSMHPIAAQHIQAAAILRAWSVKLAIGIVAWSDASPHMVSAALRTRAWLWTASSSLAGAQGQQ